MKIDYIHEPTDLQCGQAVLAMLLGTTAEYICQYLDNDRETDLREMKRVLTDHGIGFSPQRRQAHTLPIFLAVHCSVWKRQGAGTGHCMRTALFTIPSMAF